MERPTSTWGFKNRRGTCGDGGGEIHILREKLLTQFQGKEARRLVMIKAVNTESRELIRQKFHRHFFPLALQSSGLLELRGALRKLTQSFRRNTAPQSSGFKEYNISWRWRGANPFNIEDGGSFFLRNSSVNLQYYTVWKHRGPQYETFIIHLQAALLLLPPPHLFIVSSLLTE